MGTTRPNFMRTAAVGAQASRSMFRWVLVGSPPPAAPRIELNRLPDKPGPIWSRIDEGMIVRDEHGNARGGIRLPDIEVPLARWHGATTENRLGGEGEPFGLDKVRALYPTREDYVAKVIRACDLLVDGGFIGSEDAKRFIDEADASRVPESLPSWM